MIGPSSDSLVFTLEDSNDLHTLLAPTNWSGSKLGGRRRTMKRTAQQVSVGMVSQLAPPSCSK